MAPTLHLVRHAQGYHNLSVANHQLHDPLLTPHGKQQCAHLANTFPYSEDIDMVVASPLKRTIYTALLSFKDEIAAKKLKVVAIPELQETSDLPCDTGSDVDELIQEFAGQPVDLSLVERGWNNKTGRWAAHSKAINERCKVARRWLREREEKEIVIVTHGGFLHYFTEDWTGSEKYAGKQEELKEVSVRSRLDGILTISKGTGWANTEFRSYTFDPASNEKASLIETEESVTLRRGVEKPLSEAEHRNLKRVATADKQKNGPQNPAQTPVVIPSKTMPYRRHLERDWIGGYG